MAVVLGGSGRRSRKRSRVPARVGHVVFGIAHQRCTNQGIVRAGLVC